LYRTVLAALLIFLASAYPTEAASRPDPRSVCFSLADIGAAYHVKYTFDYDKAQIQQKLTPAQRTAYRSLVAAYGVMYERKPVEGLFWLTCSAALFSSTQGAASYFSTYQDPSGQLKRADARPTYGIGVQARSWLMDIGDPGKKPVDRQYQLEFRRGHYMVDVTTYGEIKSFSKAEGIKLARLVDRRIQREDRSNLT
jgi:hypothetical protein